MSKLRYILGLGVVATSGLMQGCGTDAATDPVTEALGTSLSAVMTTASEKLAEATPGTASAMIRSKSVTKNSNHALRGMSRAAMGEAEFETSLDVGALSYFTTPASLVDYIIEKDADVDPSDGMGLINRFKQKIISGMCPIMNTFPDANSDGIPDVGSGTARIPDFSSTTVQDEYKLVCPDMDFDNLTGASGMSVTYTVEDVSAETGSLYDIRIELSLGGGANVFYYRADGSVIRFVFMEADGTTDSSGAEFAFFEYNGTRLRFEMYGGHQDGHYRMLYNTSTKDLTLYAHLMNGAASANKRVFLGLVGNRGVSVAALTISADATGNSGSTVTNGQACVDLSGSSSAWSSAVVSGKCGDATAADFSTEPAAATAAYNYAGTVGDLSATFESQFTTSAEVFSKAIFAE